MAVRILVVDDDRAVRESLFAPAPAAPGPAVPPPPRGDELVIVFPNSSEKDLHAFCERLKSAVNQHVFCKGLHDLKLTVSIGIASSSGQDWLLLSSDNVVSQADKALYMAKLHGRNRA